MKIIDKNVEYDAMKRRFGCIRNVRNAKWNNNLGLSYLRPNLARYINLFRFTIHPFLLYTVGLSITVRTLLTVLKFSIKRLVTFASNTIPLNLQQYRVYYFCGTKLYFSSRLFLYVEVDNRLHTYLPASSQNFKNIIRLVCAWFSINHSSV